MASPAFLRAFQFTCGPKVEGGLSLDPEDNGNWTGGAKGKGELRGTKYGISAKQYPQMDIAALRIEKARDIFERDYWLAMKCDLLPPRLALCVFDTAVNMGLERAARVLQAALDVAQDGVIGPHTLAAARVLDQNESCVAMLAERALAYASFKQFKDYGRGWFRRCMRAAMEVGK
jgi:lysozyme family protein